MAKLPKPVKNSKVVVTATGEFSVWGRRSPADGSACHVMREVNEVKLPSALCLCLIIPIAWMNLRAASDVKLEDWAFYQLDQGITFTRNYDFHLLPKSNEILLS